MVFEPVGWVCPPLFLASLLRRAPVLEGCPHSQTFPKEFKDDVVRVARSGKFTHDEVAHDFQISV